MRGFAGKGGGTAVLCGKLILKFYKEKKAWEAYGSLLKNALSGHDGHYQEMDWQMSGLEHHPRPAGHVL